MGRPHVVLFGVDVGDGQALDVDEFQQGRVAQAAGLVDAAGDVLVAQDPCPCQRSPRRVRPEPRPGRYSRGPSGPPSAPGRSDSRPGRASLAASRLPRAPGWCWNPCGSRRSGRFRPGPRPGRRPARRSGRASSAGRRCPWSSRRPWRRIRAGRGDAGRRGLRCARGGGRRRRGGRTQSGGQGDDAQSSGAQSCSATGRPAESSVRRLGAATLPSRVILVMNSNPPKTARRLFMTPVSFRGSVGSSARPVNAWKKKWVRRSTKRTFGTTIIPSRNRESITDRRSASGQGYSIPRNRWAGCPQG